MNHFYIFMFLLCMSEIKSEDVKSNAYDDFLIYYKRDHSLQVNDLNDLTGKLLYKFGCLSKNCDKVHLYFIFNISFGNSFFGLSVSIVVNFKLLVLLEQLWVEMNLEMFQLLSCVT